MIYMHLVSCKKYFDRVQNGLNEGVGEGSGSFK